MSLYLFHGLLSWILEKLMYVAPGYNPNDYISVIIILFLVPFIVWHRQLVEFVEQLVIGVRCHSNVASMDFFQKSLLGLLLIVVGVMISYALYVPIYGNDTLEYLTVAREIYEQMSFRIYPLIDETYRHGYFPWTHPTG